MAALPSMSRAPRLRDVRPPQRLAPVVAACLVVACVSQTTRYFLPSPRNPTYDVATAERVLTDYVQLQCAPRREAQRPDTGSAAFVVTLDSIGKTERAQLTRSSNDAVLDDVFGTVAAQLVVRRDSVGARTSARTRAVPMRLEFRCSADSATVRLVAGSR